MLASRGGHVECIKVLADHKADMNMSDVHQWRACHYAAHMGHPAALRLVAAKGCDVENGAFLKEGGSLLHLALRGDVEDHAMLAIVEECCRLGTSLKLRDEHGFLVRNLAQRPIKLGRTVPEAVIECLVRYEKGLGEVTGVPMDTSAWDGKAGAMLGMARKSLAVKREIKEHEMVDDFDVEEAINSREAGDGGGGAGVGVT